jgi:hypothetical protein
MCNHFHPRRHPSQSRTYTNALAGIALDNSRL